MHVSAYEHDELLAYNWHVHCLMCLAIGTLGSQKIPPMVEIHLHCPLRQVVLVDGCGVLHPQRCGSASHLGVVTGFPTIGVAKNILLVDGIEKPRCKLERGEALPLTTAGGEVLGAALVAGAW